MKLRQIENGAQNKMTDRTNGIAAVAAKFQDRTSQLASEQATLEFHLEKLREVQRKLREEEWENRRARLEMLKSVGKRYTIEVDWMELQDKIALKKRCVEQERDEVEMLQAKIGRVRRTAATLQEYYSIPRAEMDLFRLLFEGEIHQKEQEAAQREDTLQKLQRDSDKLKGAIEDMDRLVEEVIQEQRQLDEQAEKEDEEIAAIGMQIKATLTKVCDPLIFSKLASKMKAS
jgi:chromosome segregation ATPase